MKKHRFILLLSVVSVVQSATENKSSVDLDAGFQSLSKYLEQYLQQDTLRFLKPLINSFKITKELLIVGDEYNEAARNAPATYNQRNAGGFHSDAFIHIKRVCNRMKRGLSSYSEVEEEFGEGLTAVAKAAHQEARRLMNETLPPDSDENKRRYLKAKSEFISVFKDFKTALGEVVDIVPKLSEEISDYTSIKQACKDISNDFNKSPKTKDQLFVIYTFYLCYIEYLYDLFEGRIFNFDEEILDNKILQQVSLFILSESEELDAKKCLISFSWIKYLEILSDKLDLKFELISDSPNTFLSNLGSDEIYQIISSICERITRIYENDSELFVFFVIKNILKEMKEMSDLWDDCILSFSS